MRRLVALDDMTESLKVVARKIDQKLEIETRGLLLLRYDVARLLHAVWEDATSYGACAIELLSHYLGIDSVVLYDLRGLAPAFSREEVEQLARRRMSNGARISPAHLMKIAREPRKDRAALLERVFEQSLTLIQLSRRLAAEKKQEKALRAERRSDPNV